MIRRTLTALALLGLIASHPASASVDGWLHGKIRADGRPDLCLGVYKWGNGGPAITTSCDNPPADYVTDLSYGRHPYNVNAICWNGTVCLTHYNGNKLHSIAYSDSWIAASPIDLDEPLLRIGDKCADREGIGQDVVLVPCSSYNGGQMEWHMGWPMGVVISEYDGLADSEPVELLAIQEHHLVNHYWRIVGHRAVYRDNEAKTKFTIDCWGPHDAEIDPTLNLFYLGWSHVRESGHVNGIATVTIAGDEQHVDHCI